MSMHRVLHKPANIPIAVPHSSWDTRSNGSSSGSVGSSGGSGSINNIRATSGGSGGGFGYGGCGGCGGDVEVSFLETHPAFQSRAEKVYDYPAEFTWTDRSGHHHSNNTNTNTNTNTNSNNNGNASVHLRHEGKRLQGPSSVMVTPRRLDRSIDEHDGLEGEDECGSAISSTSNSNSAATSTPMPAQDQIKMKYYASLRLLSSRASPSSASSTSSASSVHRRRSMASMSITSTATTNSNYSHSLSNLSATTSSSFTPSAPISIPQKRLSRQLSDEDAENVSAQHHSPQSQVYEDGTMFQMDL